MKLCFKKTKRKKIEKEREKEGKKRPISSVRALKGLWIHTFRGDFWLKPLTCGSVVLSTALVPAEEGKEGLSTDSFPPCCSPQNRDAGSVGHVASPESVAVIKKVGNERALSSGWEGLE